MYVDYNGCFYRSDEPVLKVSNRAFLYGDGLFESMRMINGQIAFIEQHLQRLKKGMETLHINVPSGFTSHFFSEIIYKLAAKNNIKQNARIKLNVFRSSGGLYAPVNDDAEYLISITELNESYYTLNSTGLHIDIFEEIKKPINKFSDFKTCNALLYVLAGVWKNSQKLDDILLLNDRNYICEGLNSNIFIVGGNQFSTVPVSEGCIHGVMRDQIIKIIKAKNGNF